MNATTLLTAKQSGNQGHLVQPKLTVNAPGDRYEREADAMADRVMRMPLGKTAPVSQTQGLLASSVQRKCAHCEEEEKKPVMRKAESGGGFQAPPGLASTLSATKGGGSPLPDGTRNFMENAFSTDFSHVRVHADGQAASMSQGIQARAFTQGSDVYFNSGQYQPESGEGRRLLAHELTHVVQQGGTISPANKSQMTPAKLTPAIQRVTFGVSGSCWFENCGSSLSDFLMIPETRGVPGFHPSGIGRTFRVDEVDGFWYKHHSPKTEWFKIPDIGTGQVSCTSGSLPYIRLGSQIPFATQGWVDSGTYIPNIPNPY